ncbi:unannotated protein [freshwater metagenome]|uniref:Unannotated protein n=1 Tax=freshwater metagenome TaxID=449393 RepID=A0A6J7AS36_9ZZZZ
MLYQIGDTGSSEVGVEDAIVVVRLVGEPLDLLGPTVVAGVRIDCNNPYTRFRGAGEHNRAAPTETADLDDRVAVARAGRCPEQALGLIGTHPAIDIFDCFQQLLVRTVLSHPTYTPSPNTTIHARPRACNHRSDKKISSGAAP